MPNPLDKSDEGTHKTQEEVAQWHALLATPVGWRKKTYRYYLLQLSHPRKFNEAMLIIQDYEQQSDIVKVWRWLINDKDVITYLKVFSLGYAFSQFKAKVSLPTFKMWFNNFREPSKFFAALHKALYRIKVFFFGKPVTHSTKWLSSKAKALQATQDLKRKIQFSAVTSSQLDSQSSVKTKKAQEARIFLQVFFAELKGNQPLLYQQLKAAVMLKTPGIDLESFEGLYELTQAFISRNMLLSADPFVRALHYSTLNKIETLHYKLQHKARRLKSNSPPPISPQDTTESFEKIKKKSQCYFQVWLALQGDLQITSAARMADFIVIFELLNIDPAAITAQQQLGTAFKSFQLLATDYITHIDEVSDATFQNEFSKLKKIIMQFDEMPSVMFQTLQEKFISPETNKTLVTPQAPTLNKTVLDKAKQPHLAAKKKVPIIEPKPLLSANDSPPSYVDAQVQPAAIDPRFQTFALVPTPMPPPSYSDLSPKQAFFKIYSENGTIIVEIDALLTYQLITLNMKENNYSLLQNWLKEVVSQHRKQYLTCHPDARADLARQFPEQVRKIFDSLLTMEEREQVLQDLKAIHQALGNSATQEIMIRFDEVGRTAGQITLGYRQHWENLLAMDQRIDANEQKIACHGERIESNGKILANLSQKLGALQEGSAQNGEKLARLDDMLASQNQRLASQDQEFMTLQGKADQNSQTLVSLKDKVVELEQQLTAQKKEHNELKAIVLGLLSSKNTGSNATNSSNLEHQAAEEELHPASGEKTNVIPNDGSPYIREEQLLITYVPQATQNRSRMPTSSKRVTKPPVVEDELPFASERTVEQIAETEESVLQTLEYVTSLSEISSDSDSQSLTNTPTNTRTPTPDLSVSQETRFESSPSLSNTPNSMMTQSDDEPQNTRNIATATIENPHRLATVQISALSQVTNITAHLNSTKVMSVLPSVSEANFAKVFRSPRSLHSNPSSSDVNLESAKDLCSSPTA